ncbi:MAG: 4-hydroxy-2-oxo-heptane-1,7-dioate aldolase [Geminicoccaceae bacterium]|nr:4-hydroxy-2-oxo-heptane-1,7-dioate aldolase [Geminicoccaceae bacterium]
MRNELKRRLAEGDRVYGCWLGGAHPGAAELLAHAGYDFLILDNEHGPADLETSLSVMRAAEAAGCPLIVRVPWNDPVYVKRILDAGAQSLMIPMIENREAAEAAVSACRYPPAGTRGYAALSQRCTRWSLWPDYLARWQSELLVIAQIESAAAAGRAQSIAAVDGVDLVLIGVNDLGGTLGHLEGGLAHPDVAAAVHRAEAGIRAAGKPMATVPSAMRTTPELFAAGYQLVAGAVDMMLLAKAARADVEAARSAMQA